MQISEIRWENAEAVALENSRIRAVILPGLGGKVVSLQYKKNQFELAARNAAGEYRQPGFDADFEKYDASGLDDAFPNIVRADAPWNGKMLRYPDHGEIWSSAFAPSVEDGQLVLTFDSSYFPYRYEKQICLEDNRMILRYEIENRCATPFPCLWTFHGLMRYEEDMRIFYPEGTECFENVLDSPELGAVGRRLTTTGSGWDFSRVPERESRTMVKYYAAGRLKEGNCGFRYPSQNMECCLRYDAEKLPYLGVWITAGGFRGDYNCALEPSSGYYDDVRMAGANGTAWLLKKGGPQRFQLEIGLRELTS